MSVIQSCHDTKDILDLFRPQGLYLKPIARLNVSVQLPQLKKSGAKISNWEVMEKSKEMAKPFSFPVFKVSKSSLEFIRFEAEIENYGSMETVLAKLDMKTIKLSGFQDLLKVRAAEAKPPFPTRHDWDTFFRENKNMNEMKPGERPDTIHVQNLPTKWFLNHHDRSGISRDKPSDFVLKKVFGCFGEIRGIDIPMLDPYREKMKPSESEIQTFTFGQDLVFDAFIQFKEYIGFVKAMNSLKGMKLLCKDRYEDRSWVANIKVDFDKTKHLAESTTKRRTQEREKLVAEEREKEEAERRLEDLEEMKRAEDLRKIEEDDRARNMRMESEKQLKIRRRMEREERRRQNKMRMKYQTDEEEMAERIAIEERKLLIAQRKLESIRVLDELLERVKVVKGQGKKVQNLEAELLKTAKRVSNKASRMGTTMTYKDQDEKVLRDKLVTRLKKKEVLKMEHFGERLRNAKENNYFESSDDGVEDISEEDLNEEEAYSEELKGKEDDELRLTSTDDDDDKLKDHISDEEGDLSQNVKQDTEGGDNNFMDRRIKVESTDNLDEQQKNVKRRMKENGNSTEADLYGDLPEPVQQEPDGAGGSSDTGIKSKKKKRKEKKEKKKKKKKEKDKDREEKDDERRRKRELASQICLAKKIAEKEKREKSQASDDSQERGARDVRRKGPDGYNDRRLHLSNSNEKEEVYPNHRQKMLEKRREAARQAAQERKAALLLQQKRAEQAKDEMYDQLVKGGGSVMKSSDKMRKLRKGEHYEDAQREFLENEIRIRERREKYESSTNISSNRRVDISNLGGASDYVDSRYHFAGRDRSRSSNRYDIQDHQDRRPAPRYQNERYDRR